VSVHVGLAPEVFRIPVQSPLSLNVPVKPCCENVTGTGDDAVTDVNCTFGGDATTGAGFACGGGFVGTDDGTGVGVAAVAETEYTAK
jgi:hypothetical protein